MSNQSNFINNFKYKDYKLLSSRFFFNSHNSLKLKKKSLYFIIFKNIINLIITTSKIFFNFFINKFESNLYDKTRSFEKRNLIISHYDCQKNTDYIFGSLFDEDYNKKSVSQYITHLDNELKSSKISPNFFKTNLLSQIKIILDLFIISFRVLYKDEYKNIFDDQNLSKYLSLSYMEYDSYCNLLIFEVLKKNINFYSFENVITTFEGHPWEILIFFYLNKKKLNSYAYLHTFLKKNSPYLNLPYNFQPGEILTVGKEMNNIISSELNLLNHKLKIIGSKKNNPHRIYENIKINKSLKNILLIPEAIDDEVDIFLKFIDSYKFSNLNIKIKLHPFYSYSDKIKIYDKYITKLNLEEIIKNVDIVIYRGTSTIFELIHNNLIFFYLSYGKGTTRDPLFYYNDKFIIDLDNIESFLKTLKNLPKNQNLINEVNLLRKKIFNYYEPFNKYNLP